MHDQILQRGFGKEKLIVVMTKLLLIKMIFTLLVNGGFNSYCGRNANLLKLLKAMEIQENCVKVKVSKQTIGLYDFKTSKLNSSKVGKQIWIRYYTNKKLLSNVSCESQ